MRKARVPEVDDSLSPDQILSNRYRVCRKIGQGGMGEVYLARDDHMQRQVAIKLLRSGAAVLDAEHAKIFEEALTTASLGHPNIVKVHDVPQIAEDPLLPRHLWGTHYMVMEFIDGETLFVQLRDRKLRAVEEALDLWLELVDTVRFAHERGVIHRDLKPGNIIVASQRIKVLDFGIAQASERATEAGHMSLLCSPSGTPWYMRPVAVQALESSERIAPDKRDDVYALGVILYQMLAGELCHPLEIEGRRSDTYLELPDGGRFPDVYLRKSCDDLIVRALGLAPGHEFLDAAALHEAGKQVIAGWQNHQREQSERRAKLSAEHQMSRQEAQHAEQQRAMRRQARRWLFAMAALAALIFWGGVSTFWYLEYRRDRAALVSLCEKAAISANRKDGVSEELLTELLSQLRIRIAKNRAVPASCVQVFNRSLLRPYGLQRFDRQRFELRSPIQAPWMNARLRAIRTFAFAPDAGIVAVGGESGDFAVGHLFSDGWKLLPALPQQLIPGRNYPIGPIAVSSDGRWLGLAYDGGRAAFRFGIGEGAPLRSADLPQRMRLSGLYLELGGRMLIGTREGAILGWRTDLPKQPFDTLFEMNTLKAPIHQLAPLKNGILLAATEHRVSLLSVSERRELASLTMKVKWLVPHRADPLELVVQTAHGLQMWSADSLRLRQLKSDLDEDCPLAEVMNNAPEAEEIVRNARNSPFEPIPDSLWACYRVVCQHLQMTASDKAPSNAACEHLEAPNHMSFMEAWGQP